MDKNLNQMIFEKKDSEFLYQKSHIRDNLTEWLELDEEDFFWHIPISEGIEEIRKRLLAYRGNRIILAFSNVFGVQSWNRNGEQPAFSAQTIEEILREMGYAKVRYFYPYPNCEFPMKIYSGKYLPGAGELRNNRYRNYRRDACFLRDEEEMFNRIIQEKRFHDFSNAYLIVAERAEEKELPVFVQYANDRAWEFQMKTEIWLGEDGYSVVKKPMQKEAEEHCAWIHRCYELLAPEMEHTGFALNHCERTEEGLTFEFLTGKTLDGELKELLEQGEAEKVREVLKRFVRDLESLAVQPFVMTDRFREVFGEGVQLANAMSMKVTDIDLIFRNLILGEKWNVIDYEWSFDFPIPIRYVIYRAFEAFTDHESEEGQQADPYAVYPMEEWEKQIYEKMEQNFQRYVSQGYHSLDEMYGSFGKSCLSLKEWKEQWQRQVEEQRRQMENQQRQIESQQNQIQGLEQKIEAMEGTKVWKVYRRYRNWRERK